MWLENTDAFLQKYCHIHSSYLVFKGPSMPLPNNFNPQIYRSDLPLLFMARNIYLSNLPVKGGQWKNGFVKKTSPYSKFEFSFPVTLCLPFKELFFSVFSNWESAEPVFCSEELSCLPYKNQNKSLTLSFGEGKFKFAVLWGLFMKLFFH